MKAPQKGAFLFGKFENFFILCNINSHWPAGDRSLGSRGDPWQHTLLNIAKKSTNPNQNKFGNHKYFAYLCSNKKHMCYERSSVN